MINHTAVVEWIGFPKTTEKEKGPALFYVLMDQFLLFIVEIVHKKSKSKPPHSDTFYSISAATHKDTNIVKLK